MSVYTISYDLNTPGKDYAKLIEAIKSYGEGYYIKPLKSQWYISTSQTAEQVSDFLERFLDSNDHFLVQTVSAGYHGRVEQVYHNWLKTHVR